MTYQIKINMQIDNKFNIGQEVFLKTDPEQSKRLVTEIYIQPGNSLGYQLSLEHMTSIHYELEITATPDIKMKYNV